MYLINYRDTNEKIKLINPVNISNNEGYDNQPSFYDDNTILFSSTRNKQTDIALYNIKEGTTTWVSNTPLGGEYSPIKIPGRETVSAIRLDTSGLQRLYEYNLKSGKSSILLKDLKVGYHVWYNKDILVSSVLVDDRMDLVVSNLKNKTNDTLQKNVGRSLHKIPNSDLISFISKEHKKWVIKSINPISGETKEIKAISIKIEDMCWLADGTILMSLGKNIVGFNLETDKDWKVLHSFKEKEINEISRIAVSPDSKYIAIVSEESPVEIVQKQIEFFNKGSLEDFVSCYSDNVIVRNYPHDTLYVGKDKLKSDYQEFFSNKNRANVEVVKRIVMGNKVIDEERADVNEKQHHQGVIYEVKNGKISGVTFIYNNGKITDASDIVEQQLIAYNAKDMDTFVKTFSDTIKAYDYPNKLQFKGKIQLRSMYTDLFAKIPDLHSEIKNRIVIGNIVIDEEYLTANGDNFSLAAIYEIKEGKIAKMIFIR